MERANPVDVSIHAPARGATTDVGAGEPKPYCFNPRTRTGCDAIAVAIDAGTAMFQSTHPHGVRRRKWVGWDCAQGFQSTHPHGVRRKRREADMAKKPFQSTHPHGVRPDDALVASEIIEFQSTHPHGVRRPNTLVIYGSLMFQSTHPHGVRPAAFY